MRICNKNSNRKHICRWSGNDGGSDDDDNNIPTVLGYTYFLHGFALVAFTATAAAAFVVVVVLFCQFGLQSEIG